MATRPTSDRLRETLFNVLGPRVAGSRFLDLYAGSGAVGIEALSRGAAFCCFVERAPAALNAIRGNLESLRITSGVQIESRSIQRIFDDMDQRSTRFDLVFLDPPYEAAGEYLSTLNLLGANGSAVVAEDGLVVAEHARKSQLPESVGALTRYRVLEQGDAALSFYKRQAPPPQESGEWRF